MSESKNVSEKQCVKIPAGSRFRLHSYCGDLGGCGFIRIIYPYMLLNTYKYKNYKFECFYNTSFINDPNYYKTFTFVQFQRSATEQHLKIINHYIKNIKPHVRVPLIYEIDDLLMDIPEWNYASSYYNNNSGPVIEIMKKVDGIVVSTEKLKEIYSQYNKNIVVIPNHLPKFLWGDVMLPRFMRSNEKGGRVRIGWAGSENHFCNKNSDEYKKGIRGGDFSDKILSFIRGTVDKYQWVLSGGFPTELDDIKDKIEYHPWVDIIHYPSHMRKLDLDICLGLLVPCDFNEGKCLVGNTKVISKSGILNISDVKNNDSLYQKESFENVHSIIKYTNQKTIKITTKKGYSIEGTINHRIKSNGEYIRLDKLNINDIVDLSFFEYPNVPYLKESVPFFLTKKLDSIDYSKLDNSMLPTITLNEKWGYFLGMFLGDGNIGQGETINISCDCRDNIVDMMVEFGNNIGLDVKKRKSDKRNTNGITVHFNSRNLKWLLSNKFGFNGGKFKKNLNVPLQIFKSPKNVIREFIKGLFDADGTVYATGCSFTTKNKQLAEEIQFLLLGFNIISYIRSYHNKVYNRTYYTLILNRQASDIFYNKIGFNCEQKNNKLRILTSKPHSNRFKEWEMNDYIVDIQTGYNDVYDVEIPNNHYYIANGFVSHNSNIKVLEYSLLGCPGVYSNVGPYQNMSLTSNKDDVIIGYIEKLSEDLDFRHNVWLTDYNKIKDDLYWEENSNLSKYMNSYLNLFGRELE
jgi:intein/homing endonuclease